MKKGTFLFVASAILFYSSTSSALINNSGNGKSGNNITCPGITYKPGYSLIKRPDGCLIAVPPKK